jgi:hypothetical protein
LQLLDFLLQRCSRATIFSVILACGLQWGCRPPPVSLQGSRKAFEASDYTNVLAHWTRSARIYHRFDTRLFVDATFHSPELRRAFAAAFPNIYGHGSLITRRELVELTGDTEEFHTFFIKLYTADPKWNDLAKADSIWHLTLSRCDGSVTVDPAEILAIKSDANLRAVYPYLGHFDKGYLVRFPLADTSQHLLISEDTTGFVLKIASALGEASMIWELERP